MLYPDTDNGLKTGVTKWNVTFPDTQEVKLDYLMAFLTVNSKNRHQRVSKILPQLGVPVGIWRDLAENISMIRHVNQDIISSLLCKTEVNMIFQNGAEVAFWLEL